MSDGNADAMKMSIEITSGFWDGCAVFHGIISG